jgi:hypothetical protein
LDELFDCLEPDEYDFFQLLDKELNKVETFFSQRQANCKLKQAELEEQLGMLHVHRKTVEKRYAHWENKMDTFAAATAKMLGIQHTPGQHSVGEHGDMIKQTTPHAGIFEKNRTDADPTSPADEGNGNHPLLAELEAEDDDLFHTDKYLQNERSMRKAMNEFYHHLEILKNYRVSRL